MRSGWARAVLVALLLALVTLPQLARATVQDESVELLVWDQFTEPEDSAFIDALYAGFTEANPNITIRREAVQAQQMQQTVRTALASGTGPDVLVYDPGPGYAGVLADAGLLQPLGSLAAEYGWNERIAASALRGGTYDGELYGVPLTVDLFGMYVNTTLMEENGFAVPTTLEEMLTFCQQASAAGFFPLAFANNPGWEAFHQFSMAANNQVGAETIEQYLFEGEANWDSPEIVAAIEAFFVTMRDAGCYSEDANALSYDDGNALFYAGDALIHSTGSWLQSEITTNMPDAEVAFVPFPALPNGAGQFPPTGVGSAYMISANSEHPDEASRFLGYLYSPEVIQRWVGEGGFVVAAQFDIDAIEATPLLRSILETILASVAGEEQLGYSIDVLAPQSFNDAMQNGFQAVLAGDKTAEQQAADMQTAWEEGMVAGAATPTP